jgi:thiol-disulfide isomerase/thioredoxin
MYVYHIRSENDLDKLAHVNKSIKHGKHVFVLVYMEGCGPCNATRPEWAKLESALKDQYGKNEQLVVVDINKDFVEKMEHIGSVDGFPTMKYIANQGATVETYENSGVKNKDRSTDSFINWIEQNINDVVSTEETSSPQHVFKRLTRRNKSKHNRTKHRATKSRKYKGGKWSRKYKASINCKRPKGFSQKQYCKYGRK